MISPSRKREPRAEAVYYGTAYIGSIASNPNGGFDAFDVDDKRLNTFESIAAARRALFELHCGEWERAN